MVCLHKKYLKVSMVWAKGNIHLWSTTYPIHAINAIIPAFKCNTHCWVAGIKIQASCLVKVMAN